ncbi:hypothetical protein CRG98_001979 [Punica granatum]|uniref:Uncharacterized protein n=1 Tax=Punica granatum TaxID=22663 RepID=A0A2I0LAD9_PUNGR|nr:hypothetical protein CRG98_001979 [Punica granatum]
MANLISSARSEQNQPPTPKWSLELYGPECALLDRVACEYPPSRGCMTDTSEKESSLTILQPEGRGPVTYPGLGVWNT